MKVFTLSTLTAALSLWATPHTQALEPALWKNKTPTAQAALPAAAKSNQALADSVASKLAGTKVAYDADISLHASNGVMTVTGTCRNPAQKTEILNEIRIVDGVTLVRDGIKIETPKIQQVQMAGGPRMLGAPSAMPPMAGMPGPGMGGDPNVDPLPLGPAGGGAEMQAPGMPGYAWPTYAPYNNLSRVAYPTAYPYNAFPFIGPFYPFPKVPLGWRKVTLEWEDGHWWIGRKQAPIDYWRVRFW